MPVAPVPTGLASQPSPLGRGQGGGAPNRAANAMLRHRNVFEWRFSGPAHRPRRASPTAKCRTLKQPFDAILPALLILAVLTAPAVAEMRLADREPFDEITLNEANGGEVLEVVPLDLPNRQLPATPPAGDLTVELVDRPGQQYTVAWSAIASIRLYERRLLAEAGRLTAAGQFDDAFDCYARLLADYPQIDGLGPAVTDYLRRNALALYQAQQYERALAVLSTLYQRAPGSPGLTGAVSTVASQIITRHLREQDYTSARAVLVLWRRQFKDLDQSAVDQWQARFEEAAGRKVGEARTLLQKSDYIAARRLAHQALIIWPELEDAHQLLVDVQREYPSVVVGVFEPSPREPVRRLDCWAALRTDRLVERLLAEEVGFGSEGGVYRSPYGKLDYNDSTLELSLTLAPAAGLTTDVLARYLLRMAEPGTPVYQPELASLLAAVAVEGRRVDVDLSRPHVRPEALLQVPPPKPAVQGDEDSGPPRFTLADADPETCLFAAVASSDGTARAGLQVVVEHTMADDRSAVDALLAGDVDVLDRLPPWQVERLRQTSGVRVGTYRLPTVHVLLPNTKRPLLATREFRRALCYGIDRAWIVKSVLLGGHERAGFEVLSGPFPIGQSHSDPVRYAYNSQITPRPYSPRLAAILAAVGWASAAGRDAEPNADLTAIPELTLAHPADPVARLACQSIKQQLGRLGIRVKLREYTADQLLAGDVDYDLRYAELAMWEPVVDAGRLLGADGLAGAGASSYLLASLRRLNDATNWRDVRSRLSEIHEIAHHDLPVIPLWQTMDYFAYRSTVAGIGDTPITLYQDVDHWDLSGTRRGQTARIQQPSTP